MPKVTINNIEHELIITYNGIDIVSESDEYHRSSITMSNERLSELITTDIKDLIVEMKDKQIYISTKINPLGVTVVKRATNTSKIERKLLLTDRECYHSSIIPLFITVSENKIELEYQTPIGVGQTQYNKYETKNLVGLQCLFIKQAIKCSLYIAIDVKKKLDNFIVTLKFNITGQANCEFELSPVKKD